MIDNIVEGSAPPAAKASSELEKAPYASPVLRVFGSVSTLTQGSGTLLCDGSNAGSQQTRKNGVCKSDRAAKENIVRIGSHPWGLGLYLFDYKPAFREKHGTGRQFGVMADEVERILPAAVSLDTDGSKQVDYTMLGITRSIH